MPRPRVSTSHLPRPPCSKWAAEIHLTARRPGSASWPGALRVVLVLDRVATLLGVVRRPPLRSGRPSYPDPPTSRLRRPSIGDGNCASFEILYDDEWLPV